MTTSPYENNICQPALARVVDYGPLPLTERRPVSQQVEYYRLIIIYRKEKEGCSLFSKCCFCIPLKTGCFILGYISMKRPGHIKLHVSVATIRLVLSIIGVVLYGPYHTNHSMLICWGDIALTTYFILIYYMYAVQLEQNLRSTPKEPREVSDIVADVLFRYPQKSDKVNLTEKNDNKSFSGA